ncbi:MAG: hypothetical protein MJ224_06645 [archaeon]|nr:hypothetical protein [archaeon]
MSDDVILPLDEFKKYYTNKTVIISNETKCLSSFGGESNVYGSSKTFHRNVKPKKKVISTSINTRLNKYVTKYKKGYKIQSHKFKVYSYQQVSIFVYKK